MNVAVLLVTHNDVGQALLKNVHNMYGDLPLPVDVVEVDDNCDPDTLLPVLSERVQQLDEGKGVLILTDMFGSTPCNLVRKLNKGSQLLVVAGVNLPMLVGVMSYANLNLHELRDKAISGGKESILSCQCE